MAELIHYFSTVISSGLELEAQLLKGEQQHSCAAVHAELVVALERAKQEAAEAGKRDVDIDEATFALVSWLDELVARFPDWWAGEAPYKESFFTSNAGNEFFAPHLKRLSAQQDEVREVYYLMLCLGFVGQYYFEGPNGAQLAQIRDANARQLPRAPAQLHVLAEEHITPQPYLSRDPAGPKIPPVWDQIALRCAVFAALLVPLALLIYLSIPRVGESKPPPAAPPIEAGLATIAKNFECARLSFTVAADHSVAFAGYVSHAEDVGQLQARAAVIDGVTNVDTQQVRTLIWPFCEVVELVDVSYRRNRDQALGAKIAPKNHGLDYTVGQQLILEATAANFPSYVYVDYYQRDGNVVHQLPNPLDGENWLAAGARKDIGDPGPGKRDYKILPPVGEELIVITASAQPLAIGSRPEVEPARDYLTMLHALFSSPQASSVAVDYVFIRSQ